MRFKLDENLSRSLATELRALGHDAHTAEEEKLVGQSDERLAAAAFAEQRMILSLDLDFGDERRFPPGRRPAIVVFRPGVYDRRFIRTLVLGFVQSTNLAEIEGATVIVEPGRTRTRIPDPPNDPRFGPAESWKTYPLTDEGKKDT